jgi:SAM-dependent methyltransferase
VQAAIGASGEDVAFFARLKVEQLRPFVANAPGRILDFGCGVGNITAELAAAFTAAKVVGCDVSARSIEHATARNTNGERVTYASFTDRLPFPDASFDLGFTSCVFHHIDREQHDHWAKELRRVLAPGGALFVFEHNPYNPFTQRVVRDCVFDKGVVLLKPRYARELFQRAGFNAASPKFYFFFPHLLSWFRPLERLLRWLPIGAQYFVIAR